MVFDWNDDLNTNYKERNSLNFRMPIKRYQAVSGLSPKSLLVQYQGSHSRSMLDGLINVVQLTADNFATRLKEAHHVVLFYGSG